MQTFKQALRRDKTGSLDRRLYRFLASYWLTPHSTTGQSPAELLLGQRPRPRLDLLHPDTTQRVLHKQNNQGREARRKTQVRRFREGDPVLMRSFRGDKWVPARVYSQSGPVSCCVQLSDVRVTRRHVDHLRSGNMNQQPASQPDAGLVDGPNPGVEQSTAREPQQDIAARDIQSPALPDEGSSPTALELPQSWEEPREAALVPEQTNLRRSTSTTQGSGQNVPHTGSF